LKEIDGVATIEQKAIDQKSGKKSPLLALRFATLVLLSFKPFLTCRGNKAEPAHYFSIYILGLLPFGVLSLDRLFRHRIETELKLKTESKIA
jgi:TctA family transporter